MRRTTWTHEISKLSAYYVTYSHVETFIQASVRALFGEFGPSGASPVTVAGIGYDIVDRVSPDPEQTITLEYTAGETLEEGEPTPAPAAAESDATPEAPEIQAGSSLRMRTSGMLDHNGRPVPDGTPVQFFFSYPQEGLEQSITPPSSRRGSRGYAQARSNGAARHRGPVRSIPTDSRPSDHDRCGRTGDHRSDYAYAASHAGSDADGNAGSLACSRCRLRCRHRPSSSLRRVRARTPAPCNRGWWPGLPGPCAGAGRGCGGRRGGLLFLPPDECAHQRCTPRGPDLPYGRVGGLCGLPALHTWSRMAAPAERRRVIWMARAAGRRYLSGGDLCGNRDSGENATR